MRRFNEIMTHHFKGFDCILAVRDPYRNRILRVYDIKEVDDGRQLVGISDGTDSWVAPATNAFFDYDLPQLLKAKVTQRGNTHSQAPRAPSTGRVVLRA